MRSCFLLPFFLFHGLLTATGRLGVEGMDDVFFHGKLRQVESRERPITEGARVVLPLFRPVPQQVQRLGSALPEHYRLAVFHDVSPFKKNECGIWLLALSNFVMLKKLHLVWELFM